MINGFDFKEVCFQIEDGRVGRVWFCFGALSQDSLVDLGFIISFWVNLKYVFFKKEFKFDLVTCFLCVKY